MKDVTTRNATASYLEISRRAAGLTREDAAKRVGVSASTIGRWEREGITVRTSLDRVAKVCDAYGISADNLCSLIGRRP